MKTLPMADIQNDPFPDLIRSYNSSVEERESKPVPDWKKDLRWQYLAVLQRENRSSLIDIGAGTGVHGSFFQSQGIDVTCIDLSPALVKSCRAKGLKSKEISVLELSEIGQTFEAGFAFNSLLHIPSSLLAMALSNIARVLEPGGLFLWGQYGGEYREGIYQDDHYQPKRFFSLLEDDQILEFASEEFIVEDFSQIHGEDDSPIHFQSLLLRLKPDR
jgi:SAM-dependent methyltransferase